MGPSDDTNGRGESGADSDLPELELTFPCPWTYTVIGESEPRVRAAIASVVGDVEHTLEFSHASRTGKYQSLRLELTVDSDEQRLRIFRELHEHPDVSYTL